MNRFRIDMWQFYFTIIFKIFLSLLSHPEAARGKNRMSFLATFDSTAELKALLSNRSNSSALQESLGILLSQLNAAISISDTESQEYLRYAGVIYKYFEGSQASVEEFLKLWELCNQVSVILNHLFLAFF